MKKIKWGVIGAGGIADRRSIPGLLLAENAQLEAIMDVNEKLLGELGEKYGVKCYKTEKELLESNIDAVYIATPVFCHKKQALLAADYGKHILLEKPLGLNAEESAEIVKYCEDRGVKIFPGLMMRFGTFHNMMKKIIAEKQIGDVVSLRTQFTCWVPDTVKSWSVELKTAGGGALLDMGIHTIDLMRYILGCDVKKLCCFSKTNTFHYEVEDSAAAILEFENGANGVVETYFNIPDDAALCRFEIYGTKGSILAEQTLSQVDGGTLKIMIDNANNGYNAQQNREENCFKEVSAEFGNMYTAEFENVSESIMNNTEAVAKANDAVYAQKVIEACYRSSAEEKTVHLL